MRVLSNLLCLAAGTVAAWALHRLLAIDACLDAGGHWNGRYVCEGVGPG